MSILAAGSQGNARIARLDMLLRRGFSVSSDYSGILCFEDALLYHLDAHAALRRQNEVPPRHVEHPVYLHKACDNDPLVQSVILTRSACKPHCLFTDILHRVPEGRVAQLLRAKAPEQGDTLATKAAKYEEILHIMLAERRAIFHKDAAAFCRVHKCRPP
jgi:hypothetical protein